MNSVQVTQLMRLLVKASVPTKDHYIPAIVGNCKSLGEWDTHRAVPLKKRNDGLWELQQPLHLEKDDHIEFKLIQLGPNGQVVWQDLPNNFNRKYKVHDEVILCMSWSSPVGEHKRLRKRRMSSNTAPSLMFFEPTKRDATMSLGNFDPFKIAEHSDEDDDELCKHTAPVPAPFNYGKKQFEELFYSYNNSIAIAKKIANHAQGRFFVISKQYPSTGSLPHSLLPQLLQLNLTINWIVECIPRCTPKHPTINFIGLRKKVGGLSDQNLEWLFHRYVQQIVPDCSIVVVIGSMFSHLKINGSSAKGIILEAVSDRVGQLWEEKIPVVVTSCEERVRKVIAQKDGKKEVQIGFEKEFGQMGGLVQSMYRSLQGCIKENIEKQKRALTKLPIQQIEQAIMDFENSIIVVDLEIISKCMDQLERYYNFLEGLRAMSSTKGRFICVVSEKSRVQIQNQMGFLMVSNIHLYLNQGKQVRLNGKWFYPFQKLDLIVGSIRKKLKKNLQHGQLLESHNHLTYRCKNQAFLRKLYKDIHIYLNNKQQICYLSVEMGEDHETLHVNWQYDSVNVFETLVRLKCMVQGSVSYALALMHNSERNFVFDCLNTLSRTFPSLFTQNYRAVYVSQANRYTDGSQYSMQMQDLKDLTFQPKP